MPHHSILALAYRLGSERITYDDIASRFGAEAAAKVLKGSGIRNRYVAAQGVCGSDLAFEAAHEVFAAHPQARGEVDIHIHCTQSPDYFMPTTACLLHEKLGLKKECASFDINLGCSQYVYALGIADSMLSTGLGRLALITTGDTMSHTVHPKDRALVPILGDAGSATLVGKAEEGSGFIGFLMGTDGSGAKHLMLPAGGFRMPITAETAVETTDAEGNRRAPRNFYMNGPAVFHFAITVVPAAVKQLLAQLNLSMNDIGLFLFHQANRYMLDYLVKKLAIPPEKTFFFIDEVGNTSGSTMPLVLAEAVRAGKVAPGMKVLMIVFGVGLSWAATVMTTPACLTAAPADAGEPAA
ncbi:MAG: ketoacyl-ACP synthase III [Bryobacteraceae bacterium]|jgi:3-oxoacyl-[acyl-carrier-protein] synthase III